MAQIFLSYSRHDAETAKALASGLDGRGHAVWWDRQISGGSEFAAEIEQALDAADVVMVLWSGASTRSPWVLDEAAEGRDTGRLLPVALDGCKPPLGFRQYQTISIPTGSVEESLDEVLRAVARRFGKPEDAVAIAAPPAGSSAAHSARGHRLAEEGKYAEALLQIEAALRVHPGSPEANREAGRLLYVQGRPADAIGFCERAFAGAECDHESASLLISCYRATGDHDALKHTAELAIARAEGSIAAGSASGPAFATGAKALAALGHADRARKWLRKALNVDPGNLTMRYTVASTLAAFLEDAAAAIEVLEPVTEAATSRMDLQLLETDPDWSSIRDLRPFQALVARVRKRIEAVEATGFAQRAAIARNANLLA